MNNICIHKLLYILFTVAVKLCQLIPQVADFQGYILHDLNSSPFIHKFFPFSTVFHAVIHFLYINYQYVRVRN